MSALNISIRVENLDRVREHLDRLSGAQAREAYAKALNDTGFHVRRAMQAAMDAKFDRVTPWIRNSPKVFKATADDLTVHIAPTLHTDRSAFVRGGKVGVDPQDVLQAQAKGGYRRDKRSEAVLRQAGILPAGWQTAIPDEARGGPFPGSDDGRGNLKGPFLRSVLSFLQTYQAGQGHVQNMKKAAKGRMREFGRGTLSKAAQQQAGPFMGRRYFISYGTNPSPFGVGINRTDEKLKYGRVRSAHIGPGIWAAMGVGKSARMRAVLIFIKPGDGYQRRLTMDDIAAAADAQDYLDRRVRFRIREAAGV